MIPLDQHVGVDVMINPPSLANFHDGKIRDDTQDMVAQTLTFYCVVHNSRINSKN